MTSVNEIENALAFMPNDDRETWTRIGMAIKDELSDAGFDIWDVWSQSADTYNERDARAVWRSFSGSGVTIKSLFKEAIDNGYVPPASSNAGDNCLRFKIDGSKKIGPADVPERADARRQWDAATVEGGGHKYLETKGIKPHGIKTNGHALLVPMRDSSRTLCGLQTITPDGVKKFILGSKVTGAYFGIGKPKDKLIIAEGFATCASIYEATGIATAVAFNCGNLKAVAEALRFKFDALEIIVAGDDDVSTKGNPGKKKGIVAAAAVGGKVAIVNFGNDRPDGATDFNDLAKHRGLGAVAEQINAASSSPTIERLDDHVSIRRASDIQVEPINWIWHEYIAQSMLHVVAGPPGCGKTTIALAFASVLSSGRTWPDGTQSVKGSILIWSGEDGAADTLIPRLIAMGADLDRVHIIEAVNTEDGKRTFDPSTDLQLLSRQLSEIPDTRLLIVDPIVSAVSGDSHKNAEVRKGLQPLVDLARAHGVAAIGITHYSKSTRGKDPLERVTGSIAFGALARIVFGTGKSTEEDGSNVMARVKSNIGPDGGGFEYTIAYGEIQPGVVGSRIEWGQPLEGTAREILNACEDDEPGGELEDAIWWLKAELQDGPVATKELQQLAKEAGHAWATVRRAKSELGAESEKAAFQGGWRWYLPAEDAHTQDHEHLRDEKTLKPAPHKAFTEGAQGTPIVEHLGEGDHENTREGAQANKEVSTFDQTRTTTGFEAPSTTEGAQDIEYEHLRGNKEIF